MIEQEKKISSVKRTSGKIFDLSHVHPALSYEWWNRKYVFHGNPATFDEISKDQKTAFDLYFNPIADGDYLLPGEESEAYKSLHEQEAIRGVYESCNSLLKKIGLPPFPFSVNSFHIVSDKIMARIYEKNDFGSHSGVPYLSLYQNIYLNRNHFGNLWSYYNLITGISRCLAGLIAYDEVEIFIDGETIGREGLLDIVDGDVVGYEVPNIAMEELVTASIVNLYSTRNEKFKKNSYEFASYRIYCALLIFLMYRKGRGKRETIQQVFIELIGCYMSGTGNLKDILSLTEEEDYVLKVLPKDDTESVAKIYEQWPQALDFFESWQYFIPDVNEF